MCEGSEGVEDVCGTDGEVMSQWGYSGPPSPVGLTGMGFVGRVEGQTRWCSRDCEDMKTPRPGHEC